MLRTQPTSPGHRKTSLSRRGVSAEPPMAERTEGAGAAAYITVWDQPDPLPEASASTLLHPMWLAGDHTPGPVEMLTLKLPLKASRFQKETLARWGGASRYRYNKTMHFLLHRSTGTTCKQVRVSVDGVSHE